MHRLSNAWRLAKASWQVLSQDKRMIGIPILAALGAIAAFAVIAGPGLLMVGGDTSASDLAGWIFVALGAIAASWVGAFGQATVIAGAAEIMDGETPRLRNAIATARRRSFRLLEWAALATGVALVLDQIEQRFGVVGRILSWLGNAAFAVLSFLALPVIVFEDLGAIAAFKRSAVLLKQTWGEQVAFGFGMGLLTFVMILPAALVGLLGWSTGLLPLQLFGVVAGGGAVVLVLAVTSALSAVFKTALYRYAIGAPVDHAFTDADLATAFEPTDGAKPMTFGGFAGPTPILATPDAGAVATIVDNREPSAVPTIVTDPVITETVDVAGPPALVEPPTSVASSDVPHLVTMVDEIGDHAKAAKATTTRATRTPKPAKATEIPAGDDVGKAAKASKSPKTAKAPRSTKAAKTAKTAKATKATKATKSAKAAKATKATKAAKATKASKAAKASKAVSKATKSAKSRKSAKTTSTAPTTEPATDDHRAG